MDSQQIGQHYTLQVSPIKSPNSSLRLAGDHDGHDTTGWSDVLSYLEDSDSFCHSANSLRKMECGENDRKRSKSFAFNDHKSSLKLFSGSDNVPRIEYSGVSSGPSHVTDMDNCQWQTNISTFLQYLANKRTSEGVDDSEDHADRLRLLDLEVCQDGGRGKSQGYPVKSTDREIQNTQHNVLDGEDNSIRHEASLLTPRATSNLESFESDDLIIQIATTKASIKAMEIKDANAEYCYRSHEAEATCSSISEGVESNPTLRVHTDVMKAPRQQNKASYDGLDLLLKAIQLTSLSVLAEEDNLPRCSDEEIKDGSENVNGSDSQLLLVPAHYIYGRSSVFKKRVLRRAKSAFKRAVRPESVEESLQLDASANIIVPASCTTARKRHTSKHQLQANDAKPSVNLEVPGVNVLPGPVIRSKRGRLQALPTRFCDSLLQPWKKKPRRSLNEIPRVILHKNRV